MSGQRVRVEAERLFERFKKLDRASQAGVTAMVVHHTEKMAARARTYLSRPVGKQGRNPSKWQRSRPGQPPRTDSGRFLRSLIVKFSPKKFVGSLSTTILAQDSAGRRYPWMVESGTKFMRKRPLFKRVQRETKREFSRAVLSAINRALRA